MRTVAAKFDGKTKSLRSPSPPGIEVSFRGQPVKGVIEFNRVELRGIVSKPLLGRKVLRVEDSFPVLVMKTGGAYAAVTGASSGPRLLRCQVCHREAAFTWINVLWAIITMDSVPPAIVSQQRSSRRDHVGG